MKKHKVILKVSAVVAFVVLGTLSNVLTAFPPTGKVVKFNTAYALYNS